jgi:hypothetical protein
MSGPFQKGQVFWDKVFIAFIIVVWFSWLVLMALHAKRWGLSDVPDALKAVGAGSSSLGATRTIRKRASGSENGT